MSDDQKKDTAVDAEKAGRISLRKEKLRNLHSVRTGLMTGRNALPGDSRECPLTLSCKTWSYEPTVRTIG